MVAGDRLGLRAPVLLAAERLDEVRRTGVPVEVEHLPGPVTVLADGHDMAGTVPVQVAADP